MALPPPASFSQINVGAFAPVGGPETATTIAGTVVDVVCPDPYSFHAHVRFDVQFTDGAVNTVYRFLCERLPGARGGNLPAGLMTASSTPPFAVEQREDSGGDKQLPAIGNTVVLEALEVDVGTGGAEILQRTLRIKVQGSAVGKREWIVRHQGLLSTTPVEE